jgi:hypothetical protein
VAAGVKAREPVPGLLARLVGLCEDTLRRRGRGEERFLAPIRSRLERRELPADRAAAMFRTGGIERLVSSVQWE